MLTLALLIALTGLNADFKSLVNNNRPEEALILSPGCKFSGEFFFYKAIAHFKIKEYGLAKRSAEQAFFYKDLPERYEVVLTKLIEEIESEKSNPNKFNDIASDMKMIENRLENAKGGQKTQVIQKRVIAKLDEEIKKIEDEIKKDKSTGGSSASSSKVPGSDSAIIKEEPPKGEISNKKLVQTTENWGKLPEKQKEAILVNREAQLPAHIREAAEGFSKALQNKGKIP